MALTKDIAVFAGASAVIAALNFGVLDELRLVVHPALVRSGTRLFAGSYSARPLQLLGTKRFDSGVFVLQYALDAASTQ